jgi:hypothetical protein
MSELFPLTPELARKIVSQIERGTCPLEGVLALNVGRAPYFVAADDILGDIEQVGGAVVRFIRGDYGEGKTHFIAMVRALAIMRNWVSTYVCLSDEIRLDRFQEVYAAIIKNCVCRGLIEERRAMVDPGDLDGWRWILDEWVSRQERLHSQDLDFGKAATMAVRERILASLDQHLRRANPVGDFSAAVRAYAIHRLDRDGQRLGEVLRWFRGEYLQLRDRGILQPVGKANSKQVLRSLVSFVRAIGYGGLAIFLDEAESVVRYPSVRRRSQAYQNLRELLDNVDGANGMQGACLYCAAVPEVFTGERGFREYEPLRERVEPIDSELLHELTGRSPKADYRAVVIDLASAPLTADDYTELARKIRQIHSCAFDWQAHESVSDLTLDKLVRGAMKRHEAESGRVRILCREIVQLLQQARTR